MLHNKRILIVRLSSIGDVLHATPVARALKEAYPTCHITWIVSKTSANLLTDNPYIDQIYIWSREELEQAAAHFQLSQLQKLWRQLKDFYIQNHFDIVLDIHGLFLSGFITAYSKAPKRIGMANTRELNRFFMTEQAPELLSAHVIKRYLSVLLPLHIQTTDYQMTLCLNDALHTFAKDFLRRKNVNPSKKLLMINPKTSWESKNWGNKNFANFINLLSPNIQILLCGSKQDQQDVDEIIKRCNTPLLNAAGQTSLLELAALICQTDLVLTGDTGTLHIATALHKPTVSLWGPTRPEQYGPLEPGHTIIQSNHTCTACHKTKCPKKDNVCMKTISPQFVADKINALLS
ncbi:lipopolysaccharide heptosyltransferase II [Anaerosinus massiliensis]|uniref:lipopolysaccharide heptosyltransferase II n=1 Tax=Massilibacillus massiliensis TaxID=1806837 RepID=UPI000DA5FD1A|nr:lipopolysaccharide heptosyltransferase II [Massilibacillus massiliensis]